MVTQFLNKLNISMLKTQNTLIHVKWTSPFPTISSNLKSGSFFVLQNLESLC